MTPKAIELHKAGGKRCPEIDLRKVSRELTDWDQQTLMTITASVLTPEQVQRILSPELRFPRQRHVLAVHWHPEQVPMDLASARIAAMFPGRRDELIIPTQHNQLLALGEYAGVEVDCYSRGFNRKVQILLHMRAERLPQAGVLANMLRHTFTYRSSQLFEYLDYLCDQKCEDSRQRAADKAGSDEEVVAFAAIQAEKLKALLDKNATAVAEDAIKNKLVRNYLDALREFYDDHFINKVQVYVKAVKEEVKDNFSLGYFYRTSEVIEEARAVGAGVVIPHPEQFWPILLAEYDIDGIEVWNPQSRQYTEFLINVVNRLNKDGLRHGRKQLVFMGDDCHLSEKLKIPKEQDPEKAVREVGLQPAWDDLAISKSLIVAGVDRKTVMDEYRARLA